jgi:two-component system chemotaxis response regulator CheY
MKVLVVDDDPAIRRLLRRVLTSEFGVDVADADDGVAALNYLLQNTVDLAVLDLNMRVIGGLEMLEAIRRSSRHARLPVVLISGHVEETGIRRALRLGVEQVIAKPFTLAGLRERFSRVLANLEIETPLAARQHQLDIHEDDVALVADVNPEFRALVRRELDRLCRVEEAPNEFAALGRCMSGDVGVLLVGATSELSSVEVFGRKMRGIRHLRDLRLVAAVPTPQEKRSLEGLYDVVVTRSFVVETFQSSLARVLAENTLGRYLLHPRSELLRRFCDDAHETLRALFECPVEMHETPPGIPGETLHAGAATELQSATAAWDVRVSCTIGPALRLASVLTSAEDDHVDDAMLAGALGSVAGRLGSRLHELAAAAGLDTRLLPVRASAAAEPTTIDSRPRLVRLWFTSEGREIATLEVVRLQTTPGALPPNLGRPAATSAMERRGPDFRPVGAD